MLFATNQIFTQHLYNPLFTEKQVSLSVVRFDTIHPVVSGNKLFKLHYFLEQATALNNPTIITFGGAYSNHLIATAFSCKLLGLKCVGFVRGEKPTTLSSTLLHCIESGMTLKFISRDLYNEKSCPKFLKSINDEFGESVIIPDGGFDKIGSSGAGLMNEFIDKNATHICCAVGTATTITGILNNALSTQKVIGIPVLKGLTDINDRIDLLRDEKTNTNKLIIIDHYHFGGYAKKNEQLIQFMNQLYKDFDLPTDFVYTAKMMYGIFDLITKDFFKKGSNIHCIHTGGLQGNASLPDQTLIF